MRAENLDAIEDWTRCYETAFACDGLRPGASLVVREAIGLLEACVENVEIVASNRHLESDAPVAPNIRLNALRRYLPKCNLSEMDGPFCTWA